LGIDAGPCHRTPGDPSQGAADGVTADGAGCQINAEADGSTLVVNWVDGSLHGDHVGETFNAGKGHHRFCWFWALVGHVVRFMRVALQETIAGPDFCCLKLVSFKCLWSTIRHLFYRFLVFKGGDYERFSFLVG